MIITSELYNFDDDALILYSKTCGKALEQNKFKNGIMIRSGLFWPFSKVWRIDSSSAIVR
jgi:hypothetical protein